MTKWLRISRHFRREDGGVLVEFAISVTLFLFIFFAMLDFGRLVYQTVLAEKATFVSARAAIVRPAACTGVPDRHTGGVVPAGSDAPRFGTSCSAANFICAPVATVTCAGSAANPTANEIWTQIQDLLPRDATIDNLQFSYAFDSNLGFLGGPYTPMVTVDINLPDFVFVSPLGLLGAAASGGGGAPSLGASVQFADFSVSMPAEDLNLGENG